MTFGFSAAIASVHVFDTDGSVFVVAPLAGDASCKICLGVALTFSQANVKSPVLAGVCGSEDAFVLVSRSSSHCAIVINGSSFSVSFPLDHACCSSI